MNLSLAIGRAVGIMAKDTYDLSSPSDISEMVLDSIYNGKWDELKLSSGFTENPYGKTLLYFLRSKDDSLLLLVSSLIYTFTMSETIDPSILFESNLYPIG